LATTIKVGYMETHLAMAKKSMIVGSNGLLGGSNV